MTKPLLTCTAFSWEKWTDSLFNKPLFARQRIRESTAHSKTPYIIHSPYITTNFVLPMCANVIHTVVNNPQALDELRRFFQRYAEDGQEIILRGE